MDTNIRMILFKEDQIDQASDAIETLHHQGISEKDISVISGIPYSEKILGRPMAWTRVPQIAIAGALIGFFIATTLKFLGS